MSEGLVPYGPKCPFRAVGMPWQSGYYPISYAAKAIKAEHNGITVDRAPYAYGYAPNPAMQEWYEMLAGARAAGHTVRFDGRWLTRAQLTELNKGDDK